MITATRNWFKRHRTKLAIGAGVIGAGYLAGQYVLNKINEARQRISEDRIAQENLRRRFRQNQEDCTYTVLALLPTVTENITRAIPVEQITQELQSRRSEKIARAGGASTASSEIAPSDVASTSDENGNRLGGSEYIHASQQISESDVGAESASDGIKRRSKIQLWNDLKISSITRALTLIYTLTLLTLLTRIQLNLLGRRTYLSSVITLASPPPASSSPESSQRITLENHDDDNPDADYGSDFHTNRKYLTFSWWLLHRGWADIRQRVETAVSEVFGSLTPRDEVTFGSFASQILEVRKKVEGATDDERQNHPWLQYLLPSREDESVVLRESGVASARPSSPESANGSGSGSGSDQNNHNNAAGTENQDDNPYAITPSLRRLLDETSDLIDSPTFAHVLTLLLDNAFSLLVDAKLAPLAFKLPPQGQSQSQTQPSAPAGTLFDGAQQQSRVTELPDNASDTPADPQSATAKLATVLAVLARQAHAIGAGAPEVAPSASATLVPPMNNGEAEAPGGNEYVGAIEAVRDLEAFAAVVYSSNWEFEGWGMEDPSAAAGPGGVAASGGLFDAGGGGGGGDGVEDAGEDSMVDLGSEQERSALGRGFEGAWGRAMGTVKGVVGGGESTG